MTSHISSSNSMDTFEHYEKKFKALADQNRLKLLYMLCQQGSTCVCDLVPDMQMAQSKLSYHLKILLDAQLITKETRGTWSYYSLNESEINHLLSKELYKSKIKFEQKKHITSKKE